MHSMDFREIGKLVSVDRLSLEYLWNVRGDIVCSSCDFTDFYFLERARVRCKRCGNDIYPLKETRLTALWISPSQWLSLIKLFELSVSARKSANDTAVSYKTARKVYDLLRRVLVEDLARMDNLLKGELEVDESYFRRSTKR